MLHPGEMQQADVVALRGAGFDDGQILEVNQIVGYFNYANRLLNGLGVDSWHAGLHPGRTYEEPAAVDPDRWSNTVFTSPRFAHFHTCNTRPPGEICWMVHDPTIRLDGVALWERGVLYPERFEATARVVREFSVLQVLMSRPKEPVGVE